MSLSSLDLIVLVAILGAVSAILLLACGAHWCWTKLQAWRDRRRGRIHAPTDWRYLNQVSLRDWKNGGESAFKLLRGGT